MKIAGVVVAGVAIIVLLLFWRNAGRRAALTGVVMVPDDDPEMMAAIANARETLPTFIEILRTPAVGQRFMLVKAKFVEDANCEHLWIADLVAEENAFRGVVADEPQIVKAVRFKQPVRATYDLITDWMVIENGKAKGAFTSRVLREKMDDLQRKAFDRSIPYKFD